MTQQKQATSTSERQAKRISPTSTQKRTPQPHNRGASGASDGARGERLKVDGEERHSKPAAAGHGRLKTRVAGGQNRATRRVSTSNRAAVRVLAREVIQHWKQAGKVLQGIFTRAHMASVNSCSESQEEKEDSTNRDPPTEIKIFGAKWIFCLFIITLGHRF